jgi:hypothetical protein
MCKETAGSFQQMLALIASMQAGSKKMDTLRKGPEANMKLFEQLGSHGKSPPQGGRAHVPIALATERRSALLARVTVSLREFARSAVK